MSEAILQMLYGTYRLLLVTLVVFFVTSARFPIVMATDRGDWRGANPFKESITIANASQNVVGSNPSAGKEFFPKDLN